jgi:hypothetical protein
MLCKGLALDARRPNHIPVALQALIKRCVTDIPPDCPLLPTCPDVCASQAYSYPSPIYRRRSKHSGRLACFCAQDL